jgi:hypothetical protein
MRRPDSTEPDPPGGRARERLNEFLGARGLPAAPLEEDKEEEGKAVPPEDPGDGSSGKEK